jgi:CheY-like chemotaxis protein
MMNDPDLTVLVVDDEPAVRGLLRFGLARHGLRVLTAEDGPTAVQMYREDARVDVVLSDVRMPGMDGPQTVDALRAMDPHVRAVFMSGDTGDHAEHDLAAGGGLVRKPFASLPDLAVMLRRAAGR